MAIRLSCAVPLLAATACAHAPAFVPPPPSVVADATAGVSDPALRDLLTRDWDASLRESPTTATSLGDHRFDDQLDDLSEAATQRWRERARAFLTEARALPTARLTAEDATTLELYQGSLAAQLEVSEACRFETWLVSTSDSNPLDRWGQLPERHVVRTQVDARNLVARFRLIGKAIDDTVANLRAGASQGRVATRASIDGVLTMVDAELGHAGRDWGWVRSASHPHDGWTAAEEGAFREQLADAVETQVRPALRRYRDLLAGELRARAGTVDGLTSIPDGARCYAASIRMYTTLPRGAEELHALGEREVARTDAEIAALGAKALGADDLAGTLARLRGDPALYFRDSDEVEARSQRALDLARARIPQFFGLLPKAPCVVERIPAYAAPYSTTAYYADPNPDGSAPGRFMINVYRPETRPRYEAAALAYHESIPGHHLQLAIAQELVALPAVRRYGDFSAFVEGWGLYAESLAGEMGLYESDLDRLGQRSYQAWRACRLIVDTGIHALGWTREQAVAYMLAHTALSEQNIRNEVNRYIAEPGQALAYKVGELTILRLRAEAEAALGARFDLKRFHDVVLGGGALTLDVLERRVRAWVQAEQARTPG
jgi:uncharacterized protein (DUF885 family)